MQSLAHYEKAFLTAFRTFYGDPAGWSLYGLLPNYLQREGSSLVYMADRLIAACGSGGFYLDDYEKLLADMARDPKPKSCWVSATHSGTSRSDTPRNSKIRS